MVAAVRVLAIGCIFDCEIRRPSRSDRTIRSVLALLFDWSGIFCIPEQDQGVVESWLLPARLDVGRPWYSLGQSDLALRDRLRRCFARQPSVIRTAEIY